jgi:type IV secretory pathway VirB10-like protein
MTEPVTPPAGVVEDPPRRSASLVDYRTMPLGVLPRHLPLWVLVGLATVMVGIMWFSSARATSKPGSTAAAVPAPVEANQQRIEEYEQRIQDQATRLTAEETKLEKLTESPSRPSAAGVNPQLGPRPTNDGSDALRQERAEREYRSVFADNVAFSREQATPSATRAAADLPSALPPTLATSAAVGQAMPNRTSTSDAPPAQTSARVGDRTYRIPEGTFIESVLTNRLDGTYAGPVHCLVTTSVYSTDRQHLLIPAGTHALGEASAVNSVGQARLAVAFHRLLLANGRRIDLEGFRGLSQVGETGLRDQVDGHYAQLFGAAAAIGVIAGLSQARNSVVLNTSGSETSRVLDRFLNVLPTVTIREGHRITIYLAKDLEVPEYHDSVPTLGGPHE